MKNWVSSSLSFLFMSVAFLGLAKASEVDSTYIEGQGYTLVSSDSKIRTNYCHTVDPNAGIFDDDFWGFPGLTYTSPSSDFLNVEPVAVLAHQIARQVLNHFQLYFRRNSFDGKGAQLISILKCPAQGNGNAKWTGKYIAFGNGTEAAPMGAAVAFDVYAHEFTHAIVEYTSNFSSVGENGALNEGFADVMGIFAKCKISPTLCNYLFGEKLGVDEQPIRSLRDPSLYGAYDYYYPELFIGGGGGLAHDGAGIVGLAFYLLSEGGTHPRQPGALVKGLGQKIAAQIFFKTFTAKLNQKSTFVDARAAMSEVAEEYGPEAVDSVKATWELLGVY